MNAFASECSSGCESGWTLYLEQSILSTKLVDTKKERRRTRRRRSSSNSRTTGVCENDREGMILSSDQDQELDNNNQEEEEEEEEDLSMLSDASSGPPPPPPTTATHNHHFHEDKESYSFNYYDNGYFCPAFNVNNGGVIRQNELAPSFLDDTASSPAFNWSKNNQASMQSTFDYSQAETGFSANNFEGRSAYQDHFSYNAQPSSLSGNQLHNNQWF